MSNLPPAVRVSPIRVWDRFDEEASAEGQARSAMSHNGSGPRHLGKRLVKQNAKHSSAKTVTSRFLVLESEKMR